MSDAVGGDGITEQDYNLDNKAQECSMHVCNNIIHLHDNLLLNKLWQNETATVYWRIKDIIQYISSLKVEPNINLFDA